MYYNRSKFHNLKIFKEWPVSMTPKSNDLAKLYIFTHVEEILLCFHCGTSLKTLPLTDDVNYLHTLPFEKCKFLQMYADKDEKANLYCKICYHKQLL